MLLPEHLTLEEDMAPECNAHPPAPYKARLNRSPAILGSESPLWN